jgi:hypothetical protein
VLALIKRERGGGRRGRGREERRGEKKHEMERERKRGEERKEKKEEGKNRWRDRRERERKEQRLYVSRSLVSFPSASHPPISGSLCLSLSVACLLPSSQPRVS